MCVLSYIYSCHLHCALKTVSLTISIQTDCCFICFSSPYFVTASSPLQLPLWLSTLLAKSRPPCSFFVLHPPSHPHVSPILYLRSMLTFVNAARFFLFICICLLVFSITKCLLFSFLPLLFCWIYTCFPCNFYPAFTNLPYICISITLLTTTHTRQPFVWAA